MKTNISCKLYLEGVLCPFNYISIAESNNSPIRATIKFPMNEKFLRLLPKTQAHVFMSLDGDSGPYNLIFEGFLSEIYFSRGNTGRDIQGNFLGISYDLLHSYLNFSGVEGLTGEVLSYIANSGDPETRKFTSGSTFLSPMASPNQAVLHKLLNHSTIESGLSAGLGELVRLNSFTNLLTATNKLLERVKILRNPVNSKYLEENRFKTILSGHLLQTGTKTTFAEYISIFLSYLFYDFIEIASPLFTDGKVQSLVFKPFTEWLSPIICNVVVPNQIDSFKFNKSLINSPTRLLALHESSILPQTGNTSIFGVNLKIAPETAFEKGDKGNIKRVLLTLEEKLRGVNTHSYRMATSVPHTDEGVQRIVDRDFYKLINNGSCTISTSYNPYRLAGFPGLVVDKVLPCVYGVFSEITTSISVEGLCKQTITISNPKLVFPSDVYKEANDNIFPIIDQAEDYQVSTIGKTTYNELLGVSGQDSSIMRLYTGKKTPKLGELLTKVCLRLREEDDPEIKFKRPLVTEKMYRDFIKGWETPYSLKDLSEYNSVDDPIPQNVKNKNFVKERINRVKEALE